jgi:hypothetical protein
MAWRFAGIVALSDSMESPFSFNSILWQISPELLPSRHEYHPKREGAPLKEKSARGALLFVAGTKSRPTSGMNLTCQAIEFCSIVNNSSNVSN